MVDFKLSFPPIRLLLLLFLWNGTKPFDWYLFIPCTIKGFKNVKRATWKQQLNVIRFFILFEYVPTYTYVRVYKFIWFYFISIFLCFFLLLFFRLADFFGWLNSMHMSLIRIRQTVCNRTWFGDIGKTYEMEIDKPNALPFVCHLNFTAPGDSHGDIIQVSTSNHSRFQFQFHFMFRLFRYKRDFINFYSDAVQLYFIHFSFSKLSHHFFFTLKPKNTLFHGEL